MTMVGRIKIHARLAESQFGTEQMLQLKDKEIKKLKDENTTLRLLISSKQWNAQVPPYIHLNVEGAVSKVLQMVRI